MTRPAVLPELEKIDAMLNAAGFMKELIVDSYRTSYMWRFNKPLPYYTLDEKVYFIENPESPRTMARFWPSAFMYFQADFTNDEGWYFEYVVCLPKPLSDGNIVSMGLDHWSRYKIDFKTLAMLADLGNGILEKY